MIKITPLNNLSLVDKVEIRLTEYIKKHKGMILSQPDIMANIEKIFDSNLLSDETLKDIFELRLILEMGMIDLLFARKTTADIKELEAIVKKMEVSHKDDSIFSLEYEVAFHGKLYEMSGNNTLKKFQDLLLPVFQYVHKHKLSDDDNFMYAKKFISHRQLVDYLKKDDIELFKKGMRQHLEPHFDRILSKVTT